MTRPWTEIIEFYRSFQGGKLNLDFMLAFAEKIKSSEYVKGLHAWTSMHDLCIVQSEVEYPYDGPYLRVHPLFDGTVEFRYIDTHVKEKQWSRIVGEDELFDRLESFLNQLYWFVVEVKENES